MFSICEMRKVLQVVYKIWTKTNPLDCLKKKKYIVSPLQFGVLSREDASQHSFEKYSSK